jgi:hypothetical protein
VPKYDDLPLEPGRAVDAIDYQPVWQHASAWGGTSYADWFCHTYLELAQSLTDLPTHSSAWHRFLVESAVAAARQNGGPFTPAETAPLGLCDRCGTTWQPAGPWQFNDNGTCLRDLVCAGCGISARQFGTWDPSAWLGNPSGEDRDAPIGLDTQCCEETFSCRPIDYTIP